MTMKRLKPEQIVTLLWQIEVPVANGKSTPQTCNDAEVMEQTYYRWRGGGSGGLSAKRFKTPSADSRLPWTERR